MKILVNEDVKNIGKSLDEQKVGATVVDEGDRGGGAEGLKSDAAVTYI